MTRKGRQLALIAVALAVVGAAVGAGALCAERQHRVLLQPERDRRRRTCTPGARLRIGGLVAARLGRQVGGAKICDFSITDGANEHRGRL